MSLARILYLFLFFAPVAFLLGFIAGAPRAEYSAYTPPAIDVRTLPVSPIDFYRQESSLVVKDDPWLKPNSEVKVR